MSPLVSLGMVRPVAVPQDNAFSAAKLFLRIQDLWDAKP